MAGQLTARLRFAVALGATIGSTAMPAWVPHIVLGLHIP